MLWTDRHTDADERCAPATVAGVSNELIILMMMMINVVDFSEYLGIL